MAEISTLPQPAQTRKSTKDRKAPRQRRKAPRFLTEPQVEDLRRTVKKTSRNPHRDSTMILVAYRHGLRVGELTDLRWEDVDLDRAEIYVRRLKDSKSTMHPLQGDELRALRKLRREKTSILSFVFISEQGGPCPSMRWNTCSSAPARPPASRTFTPTCCATVGGTGSSTKAPTPALSRTTSATATVRHTEIYGVSST